MGGKSEESKNVAKIAGLSDHYLRFLCSAWLFLHWAPWHECVRHLGQRLQRKQGELTFHASRTATVACSPPSLAKSSAVFFVLSNMALGIRVRVGMQSYPKPLGVMCCECPHMTNSTL